MALFAVFYDPTNECCLESKMGLILRYARYFPTLSDSQLVIKMRLDVFFFFHDSDERLLIMHEPASASIEASSNEPSQLLMTVS